MDSIPLPVLVLIRGLPGSGKSYLADALAEKIGADKVTLLDPDTVDFDSEAYKAMAERLTQEGVDKKFFPYRFSRERAYEAIEANKLIIWNQAFTNLDGFQKTVANLQNYAIEHGTVLPLLVVEVEIEPKIAQARIAARRDEGGHDVPAENFERFMADYRSFAGEGFHTLVVNGQSDISQSVDAVMSELGKL